MKKTGDVNLIVGGVFLGVLLITSVISAIGFFRLELTNGGKWWNDSGLSSWAQAFGSVLSVIVALALPLVMRNNERRKIEQSSWEKSDIAIRYNSSAIKTNEELIRIAEIHLKEYLINKNPISREQILPAIRAIVSVKFEDILLISEYNYELSKSFAEFHSCLNTLIGVLDRNNGTELMGLEKTIAHYLGNLKIISNSIRDKTIVY